jgi:hypothetical protein
MERLTATHLLASLEIRYDLIREFVLTDRNNTEDLKPQFEVTHATPI